MVEKELVSGDGWLSDDSSFYGDEEEQERLLSLCGDCTEDFFRSHCNSDLNTLLADKRTMSPPTVIDLIDSSNSEVEITASRNIGNASTPVPKGVPLVPGPSESVPAAPTQNSQLSGLLGIDRKAMERERLARLGKRERSVSPGRPSKRAMKMGFSAPTPASTPDLRNTYEGLPNAWQLNESVSTFLQRLPPVPATFAMCTWIRVANPYPGAQGKSEKVDEFVPRGRQLLDQALNKRDAIRKANLEKPKGAVTRLLNQEGEALKQQITELAGQTDVVVGKWMLFPDQNDLIRLWQMVVEATISNRLGCSAKVGIGENGSSLICVYTKNFNDTEDVHRVLNTLDDMGLVNTGRGIYYKADWSTYLNIYSHNAADYGLKASAYWSKTMLASTNFSKSKPNPQKKQSTLDAAFRLRM